MKRQGSGGGGGAATAAAGDGAMVVDRLPKVRLDVLTSRLLHEQDYEALSSSSSLSSASASDFDTAAANTSTWSTHSAAPRLPLAALARAEEQLRRPLTLTRGGLKADFSAEDIGNITDPAVLRYLAERGEASTPRPPSGALPPPAAGDIEAQTKALQDEIDTFITAVDNEGRSYDIQIGPTGRRQIAIADEEVVDEGEEEEEEAEEVATADTVVAHDDGGGKGAALPLVNVPDKPSSATARPAGRVLHRVSVTTRPPQSQRHAVRDRPSAPLAPSPPPAHASTRRTGAAAPSRPPAIAVRPQAGLTQSEEVRVDGLLSGATFANLCTRNPFACHAELAERLRELERRVSCYVAVRGGRQLPSLSDKPPTAADDTAASSAGGDDGGAATTTVTSATTADAASRTAADLGNAYMRGARQSELTAQRMRRVNQRLQALQRRSEELALAPADDTPASVRALRPSWARQTAAPVSEEEVQRLLQAAREEEERARAAGLTTSVVPTVDPFTGLRDVLRGAGSRAMELLAAYDANPPALRDAPHPADEGGDESTPDAIA